MNVDSKFEQLLINWKNALETCNPTYMVETMYSDSAVLLPIVSPIIRTTSEDIEDYFEHFMSKSPKVIKFENIKTQYNSNIKTVILSGNYDFKMSDDSIVKARYTFVFKEHIKDEWLIINHHSSALPEMHLTNSLCTINFSY